MAWTSVRARLLAAWEGRSEEFDDLLDELARAARHRSALALELLLTVVHELGLARPAIARLLVDPDQVDEAAQATLVAVEGGIGSFEQRARFRTWLFTVARNEAVALLRRGARGPVTTSADDALAAWAPQPRRLSSVVASRATVEEALDALPAPYRETLELRVRSQLEYREIAARLGVPVGTVRSRLNKARELLAAELGGSAAPGPS